MERLSEYIQVPREFFERETTQVARDVLGKNLVRIIDNRLLIARIVEVEAYLRENDPAAHASAGVTKRTRILYGAPGHAYIFQMRGYNCLNFVVEPENSPGCVLIRAVEPVVGIDLMKQLRGKTELKDKEVANGPGKLCRALGIDMALYGTDLVNPDSPLQVCDDITCEDFEIEVSKRIGITKAADRELRFAIKGNIFVSK